MRKMSIGGLILLAFSLILGACSRDDVDVDALSTIVTLTAEARQTQGLPDLTGEPETTPTPTRTDELLTTGLPSPELGAPARLSELAGLEVRDPQGELAGIIQDIVLDLTQRQVRYMILDMGGTLEGGQEFRLVPWEALSVRLGENIQELHFQSLVPASLIALGPVWVREPAPNFEDPDWETVQRAYWERTQPDLPPRPAPPTQGDNEPLVAALGSQLLGLPVVTRGGEAVGQVEEVLFDLEAGEVQYLVISAGGVLGIGEKWIPTPVSILELAPGREEMRLLADREQLSSAPNFDLAQLPDASDPSWDADILEYWQQSP